MTFIDTFFIPLHKTADISTSSYDLTDQPFQ